MRLLGYATRRSALGWGAAYVPLADLTVLLGANDVGKSTILGALAEDLNGGPPPPFGDEMPTASSALFVEVDDRELQRFISTADRRTGRFAECWSLGGYERDALDEARSKWTRDAELEEWPALLANAAQTDELRMALKELSGSRIVCFETEVTSDQSSPRRTAAYWCLPPLGELDPALRDALASSELPRFAPRAGRLHRLRFGGDAHLELDSAPIPIAPLGWQPKFATPRPLRAPADFSEIREAVADAVTRVVVAVRHGESDGIDETLWDRDEIDSRRPPGVWLRETDEGWQVDPIAVWALDVLMAEARDLLAPFVSDRYDFRVRFRRVNRWFTDQAIALELCRRDRGNLVAVFPIDDVAEGLRLWVQLALVGAAQETERMADALRELASDAAYEAREQEASDDDEPPSPDGDRWREVVAAIERSSPGHSVVPDAIGHPVTAARFQRRVVLIDEPERHLHPRLQREAASWLQRLVIDSATPCVAASHSHAFLSLATPASFVHVSRNETQVVVERLDPGQLDALDGVARELGFDRGELLASVGCFLLVEGVHDQIVIETVFAREVREAGVRIVPLRGGAARSLLDVDVLWRYTTASVALALDNIDPEDLRAAQAGDTQALARLTHADSSAESKAAGNLLTHAIGTDRRLHLLAHPGTDLIDALLDDAVKHVYPEYPGAEAMQADWQAHVDNRREAGENVKAGSRKSWLQRSYGIDNSREAYVKIAAAHVELGLRPSSLERIVESAVRLSVRTPDDA